MTSGKQNILEFQRGSIRSQSP